MVCMTNLMSKAVVDMKIISTYHLRNPKKKTMASHPANLISQKVSRSIVYQGSAESDHVSCLCNKSTDERSWMTVHKSSVCFTMRSKLLLHSFTNMRFVGNFGDT